MEMTYRYEVQQVNDCWTVVQYEVDDQGRDVRCLGGDRHWTREQYAEEARHHYEVGTYDHGTIWRVPSVHVTAVVARHVNHCSEEPTDDGWDDKEIRR